MNRNKQTSRVQKRNQKHSRDFHRKETHQRKRLEKRKSSRDSGHYNDHLKAAKSIANSSPHPVRKKVDPETLQYFEEIYSLLGTESRLEETEERMTLIENALEETHGKECELACEKLCSRVLEMLILSSNATQIASFLHRLSPNFVLVSNDAAGSHVAEALLKSAAVILRDCESEAAWFKTLDHAFTMICKVLGDKMAEVMSNCYGSHVVRSLLSVLSGVPLELSHKGSRGGGLSSRLTVSENPADSLKQGGKMFPHLLQLLIGRILGAAKEKALQLCMDPFASPVLQALLIALAGDVGTVTEALCVLLGCNKKDEILDQISSENLRQLMFDNYGSHLVEVMLKVAPGDIYQNMFQQISGPHLLEYAPHPSANFVVQALIASIRNPDQVAALLSDLKPHFWSLIRAKRSGILTTLLKACQQYQSSQKEVCSSLAKALNLDAAPSCLVPRLLFLESYARSNGSKEWKPVFTERMSVLGCAMLQLIFSFPTGCNQLFMSSLLSMEPAEILATVKDPGGCRVIESLLSSDVSLKQKNRLISKLKGHFAELASEMFSSFTLEKCFYAGAIDLKQAIVAELVAVYDDLARSKHGSHLIKRFDVTGYSKAPDYWRKRLVSKEGTIKAFADVFDPKKTSGTISWSGKRKAMGLEPELHGNKKRKKALL